MSPMKVPPVFIQLFHDHIAQKISHKNTLQITLHLPYIALAILFQNTMATIRSTSPKVIKIETSS